MSLTLLALLIAGPQTEAEPPLPTRMCTVATRASVQLAYKPYDNAVFGSDGVTCRTVKPGKDEDLRSPNKAGLKDSDDGPKPKPE